jgi:hypothetical protein
VEPGAGITIDTTKNASRASKIRASLKPYKQGSDA